MFNDFVLNFLEYSLPLPPYNILLQFSVQTCLYIDPWRDDPLADDDELSDSSSDDDEDEKLDPNQDDDVCICGECKFGDPNIGGKCCGQNPCLRGKCSGIEVMYLIFF